MLASCVGVYSGNSIIQTSFHQRLQFHAVLQNRKSSNGILIYLSVNACEVNRLIRLLEAQGMLIK